MILNPKIKQDYVSPEEFKDIITIRLFFMSNLKRFMISVPAKINKDMIDVLLCILTNTRVCKWTVEDFCLFQEVCDHFKANKYTDKEFDSILKIQID